MKSFRVFFVIFSISFCLKAQVPVIQSISPEKADAGAIITIYGSNFNADTSLNKVFFGGLKAVQELATNDSIKVRVPVCAPYDYIIVNSNGLNAFSPHKFIPLFDGARNAAEQFFSDRTSFQTESASNFWRMPNLMKAADLNNDGKNDMIITAYSKSLSDSTGLVYIYMNQTNWNYTNISFQRTDTYAFGYGINGLEVADFDGDGRFDIAITEHYRNELQFIQNTTTGAYPSFKIPGNNYNQLNTTGPEPMGIAITDLDFNGKTDVCVAVNGVDSLMIFRNNSHIDSINFVKSISLFVPGSPEFVAFSDLDNDGKKDIISSMNDNRIACFLNTGSGSSFQFAPAVTFPSGPMTRCIKTSDFNGDGLEDLVVTNYGGVDWCVSVLINNSTSGNISFKAPVTYYFDGYVRALETGDLNGDGMTDFIVGTNTMANKILNVFINRSSISEVVFNRTEVYAGTVVPTSFVIADFNADMKPDICLSDVTSYNSWQMIFNGMVTDDSLEAIYNTWAPVGATWHYSLLTPGVTGYNYTQYTSVSDEIVNGKNCRKIEKIRDPYCMNRPVYEFMYSSNDTVFCLDTVSNSFFPLYIFNTPVGGSWSIPIIGDSLIVTVDSISTTYVKGLDLKTLWVHYTRINDLSFFKGPERIVQRMGDTEFMFQTFDGSSCQGKYPDKLRCYEDNFTGLYKPDYIPVLCIGTTGIDDNVFYSIKPFLYPSPSGSLINIGFDNPAGEVHYIIYDDSGRSVMSGSFYEKEQVAVKELKSGLYTVLFLSDEKNYTLRFVKE